MPDSGGKLTPVDARRSNNERYVLCNAQSHEQNTLLLFRNGSRAAPPVTVPVDPAGGETACAAL